MHAGRERQMLFHVVQPPPLLQTFARKLVEIFCWKGIIVFMLEKEVEFLTNYLEHHGTLDTVIAWGCIRLFIKKTQNTPTTKDDIISALQGLRSEERLEILREFCRMGGCSDNIC